MTFEEKKDLLAEANEAALLADGFEDALIGMGTVFSNGPIAVYDFEKRIEVLKKRDGRSDEEAREYMDFNVTGAFAGEHTPAFVTLF